jgi:hypothetical protein
LPRAQWAQNNKAARYAGINVNWIIVLTMMIAGGLAGLAGAIETLGLNHKFAPEFTGGVGFDGITVALLGQTNPIGVVLSAFLLGALDAGGSRMQFDSGVSRRHHPDHPGAGAGLRGRADDHSPDLSHPQAERSDRIHRLSAAGGGGSAIWATDERASHPTSSAGCCWAFW